MDFIDLVFLKLIAIGFEIGLNSLLSQLVKIVTIGLNFHNWFILSQLV